jgi:hypothetical protein
MNNYIKEFKNIKMFAGLDHSRLIGASNAQLVSYDHAKRLYDLGPDAFSLDFQQLKKRKVFDKNRNYTQFRKVILKILKDNSIDPSGTLVEELTRKVESLPDKLTILAR